MLRLLVAGIVVLGPFSLGSVAPAADLTELGLPIVAPDSQLALEREPEPQLHPKDERWLNKPLNIGLSAMLGFAQRTDPFLLTGVDFGYALPYVSLGGTLGYLGGVNASLALRGRLHLGHAVALTLGVRGALLPLDSTCWFDLGQTPDGCEQKQHWDHAFLGGGEGGIEGRTEAGFIWRVQAGYLGLLAHGSGSCTPVGSEPSCQVVALKPGVVATEELTLGWAF